MMIPNMDTRFGEHVTGPTVELAAKVKKLLESNGEAPVVETSYGLFYVKAVELAFADGDLGEAVGYLVPDEADGKTFDLVLPGREQQ